MPWHAPLVAPGLVVDLAHPFDLSWPVRFDETDSKTFGIPPARTQPFVAGGFIGDVRRGGSCNCETHHITPHGDGTHTEGVGHVLAERIHVVDALTQPLLPALLVSIEPLLLERVDDEVSGNHAPSDRVIDQLSLEEAMNAAAADWPGFSPRALVVRTQPPRQRYPDNPAYFTVDAMLAVRARGIDHVLVDLPSLDRGNDGGILGAHRAFFDAPHHTPAPPASRQRTVTELCAIPTSLKDGAYALNLQLAPLLADAVPSRPLLFALIRAPLGFGAQRTVAPSAADPKLPR
jgi:hypothetical protein